MSIGASSNVNSDGAGHLQSVGPNVDSDVDCRRGGGSSAVTSDGTVPPATSSELTVTPGGALSAERRHHDLELVKLWLYGRSVHTARAYAADAARFFRFVNKPLADVTLKDLHGFSDHLKATSLRPGSRHRVIATIKSLFSYACRPGIGYLKLNIAMGLKMPAGKDTLNERILDESEVRRLVAAETNPRNKIILQLLYNAGIRVSELTGLTWPDVTSRRGGAGQITVLGKGNKTRAVLLPPFMWQALNSLRRGPRDAGPVFLSARGGKLDTSQVLRIVKAAAKKAQIDKAVSPHWLRHCHCSHALDGGSPIHLVQASVGHSSVATTSKYLHARPTESSSSFVPQV